jgi:hypothetical protein
LKRIEHEPALHFRRDGSRPLIDGNNPAGMYRLGLLVIEDFVLRVGHLHRGLSAQLDQSEEDRGLTDRKDVAQKGLIQPGDTQGSARVPDEGFENLEPGPPRRPDTTAEDTACDRRGLTRFERGNRLETAAILVPDRKAVQQIFEGLQPCTFEVSGTTRTNALQVL